MQKDAAIQERRRRVKDLARQPPTDINNILIENEDSGADHEDNPMLGPEYEEGSDNDCVPYTDNHPIKSLQRWNVPIATTGMLQTIAHKVFYFVDWMTKAKTSKTAALGAWDYARFTNPSPDGGPVLPPFATVDRLVQKHRNETMLRVDCCVDMCVAYWTPTHPKLQQPAHANEKLIFCPVCSKPRYILNPKTNEMVAQRQFFYLPFKYWQQDLFTKKEMIPSMANDLSPEQYPPGHVRRSNGWRIKVTENPNIAAHRMNRALTVTTDGVPYFDDQNGQSGWPIVLVDEGLPPSVAKTEEHAHLVALVPTSYWDYSDESKTKLVAKKRLHIHTHIDTMYTIYIYMNINI